jgi:hypothetical protein
LCNSSLKLVAPISHFWFPLCHCNLTHSSNKILYQYFVIWHSTLLFLPSPSSSHFTAPFSVLIGLHMPFLQNLYRVEFEAAIQTNRKRNYTLVLPGKCDQYQILLGWCKETGWDTQDFSTQRGGGGAAGWKGR